MTKMTEIKTDVQLSADQLADRIVAIVGEVDPAGTSHAELLNRLGDGYRGKVSVGNDATNVVMFVGMSESLADAILRLFAEKRLDVRACDPLVLFIDGCPIPGNIPFARRPPKGGYKHPHFLPVLLAIPKPK